MDTAAAVATATAISVKWVSLLARFVPVVVIAKILLDFLIGNPLQGPTAGPRPRVSSWVFHRHFIFERIEIRTRDPFRQVERLGMRKAAVRKPESLVEADRVEHQGIALPIPH